MTGIGHTAAIGKRINHPTVGVGTIDDLLRNEEGDVCAIIVCEEGPNRVVPYDDRLIYHPNRD